MRRNIACLTFAPWKRRLDLTQVTDPVILEYKPAPETATEHRINLVMSAVLVSTVVGLWIYFR